MTRALSGFSFSSRSIISSTSSTRSSIVASARSRSIDVERLRIRPALQARLRARTIHEDASHRLRRRAEKMRAVAPQARVLFGHPHPCFMNESGRLQRLPRRLSSHVSRCQISQFIINQGQKLCRDRRACSLYAFENFADVDHGGKRNLRLDFGIVEAPIRGTPAVHLKSRATQTYCVNRSQASIE